MSDCSEGGVVKRAASESGLSNIKPPADVQECWLALRLLSHDPLTPSSCSRKPLPGESPFLGWQEKKRRVRGAEQEGRPALSHVSLIEAFRQRSCRSDAFVDALCLLFYLAGLFFPLYLPPGELCVHTEVWIQGRSVEEQLEVKGETTAQKKTAAGRVLWRSLGLMVNYFFAQCRIETGNK